MAQLQKIQMKTASGYVLPATWFAASDECRAPKVLLMAALGIGGRFYQPLAVALQSAGINVLLLEQRGHGESAVRPGRHRDWGFREALLDDIPAAMSWCEHRVPDQPLYLMGHSLGGHYAAMATALYPEQIHGVILAACGSPWLGGFERATALKLSILCTLIPPASALFGYYPGNLLGFAGKEARTVMADWRSLALTGKYSAAGMAENFDDGIAAFKGDVLVIRMADDDFAPAASVRAVYDKFSQDRVTEHVLTRDALEGKADHYGWARNPDAVVSLLCQWLML